MLPLYDINVLIAMIDNEQAQHETAITWHDEHAASGWATCPITQNGLIRIMSQPAYTRPLTTRQVTERLHEATLASNHYFLADNVSLADPAVVAFDALLSHKTITDIYLLALAISHNARFITFDHGISLRAVVGAAECHLVKL